MSPQYSQLRFLHKVLQSSSKHLNILAKSQFDAYRPGLLRTRNADWYLGNSLGPRKFQTNLAQARLVRPILQHGKRGEPEAPTNTNRRMAMIRQKTCLPSLKLTFSHLKMDGWDTSGAPVFRGSASFRECSQRLLPKPRPVGLGNSQDPEKQHSSRQMP